MTEITGVTGSGQAGNVESAETQVATVRYGETSLADVAKRLNLDLAALTQANPQISNPNGLKAGQDIRLPETRSESLPAEPASWDQTQQGGPQPPPSGDPMAKTFAQMRLNQGTVLGFQYQSTINPTVQVQAPTRPTAAAQADIDALGQAAAAGDLQKVKDLLKAGVDINGKDSGNGMTPLMQAAASGQKAIVQLLLGARPPANVNASDLQNRTAIFLAAQKGHADVIDMLRKNGGDPTMLADGNRSPLMEAAAKGDVASINALIKGKGGADVNDTDNQGRTALMEAAASGNPKAVKVLLDNSADVGRADDFQRTALLEAARQGNRESVKLLLDKIAGYPPDMRREMINVQNENGRTALMEAASKGNKDAFQLLVGSKDVDVNLADKKGRTAVMDAARNGTADMVKALVNKGANVNAADRDGTTALMEAAKEGHGDSVEIMVKAKNPPVDLNLQDTADKTTALMYAVGRGNVRAVKALVNAGARLDIQDADGETALSVAKRGRQVSSMQKEFDEIIKLLTPKSTQATP